jgi:glycosyltransferase involved in cell wall biosynthesis
MRILHLGWGFSPWRQGGLIAYAEDLMAAQARRGHRVSYFCSGRHYPYLSGPRLKRRRRGEVAIYEVINPPIVAGLERGTRDPERDLAEPVVEAVFRRVLEKERPQVVHIQELHGLPSSLIDVARAQGIPTLMTLQDYFPLCATLRLYDADGQRCLRRDVGADCVKSNAEAPRDAEALVSLTLRFEMARARRAVGLGRVDLAAIGPLIARMQRRLARATKGSAPPADTEASAPSGHKLLAGAFQRRRDVNVERLGRVDRLVAQSPRVAEIYRTLGVSGERMTTVPFTLGHIEQLRPRSLRSPPDPVTFATINGCVSPSKGSEQIRAALRALREAGAEGGFRLRVLGQVDEPLREELTGFRGVDLHGPYEYGELDALLDRVDVGLMPSMWEEALGYAGLEFVAKGIPLIANPLGGITEYARAGETAWLNGSCSGEELAKVMLGLVRQPERVLEMHRRLMAVRDSILTPMARHVDAIESSYRELLAAGT